MAVFTSGEFAMVSAICFAARSRGSAANFDFDYVPGAFAIGDDLQGERLADEFQRRAEFFPIVICVCDFARAGCAVGQQRDGVVGGGVAVHGDGVEGSLDDGAQRAGEQRGGNGRVGGEKAEHGGHVGLNHSGAFGAAEDANLFAADAAFRSGPFGARVCGHDGAGEFGEGAGRAVPRASEAWNCVDDFLPAQRNADDACGTHQNLRRMQAPEFAGELQCGGGGGGETFGAGAAIGVAGIDDHAAHAVRRLPQMQLRGDYGRGLYAIGREDRGGRCGGFADQYGQIEFGLFQAAVRGGESETLRDVGIG